MRLAILFLFASACFGQTTLVTDTYSGCTNGTALTSHTANSGNTYSQFTAAGTLVCDGTGMFYDNANSIAVDSISGTTFATNRQIKMTFDVKAFSDAGYAGVSIQDTVTGGCYQFISLPSTDHGGGFTIFRSQCNAASGGLVYLASWGTPLTVGTTYTANFYLFTNGTSVSMYGTVSTGGSVVWNSPLVTDTQYPNPSVMGVTMIGTGSCSATLCHHAGNLVGQQLVNIPVNGTGLKFMDNAWNVNGSTNATSPYAGAYLYLAWTGTAASLNIDTSSLGANPAYIRVSVDGGSFVDTNVQGASTLVVGINLSSALHQAWIIYRGRTSTVDSWNTPTDGFKIVSAFTDGAGSAPTVNSATALIYGDSRPEGLNDLGAGTTAVVEDSSASYALLICRALVAECQMSAVSGLGWQWTGATNVPAFFVPGNDAASSWNKIYSGVSRNFPTTCPTYVIEQDLGTNDLFNGVSDANVTASVSGWLTAMRTSCSSSVIIILPGLAYEKWTAVTTGFNNYQASTPDRKAYLIDPGFTAAQSLLVHCQGEPANSQTWDGCHPNTTPGHPNYGAQMIKAIEAVLGRGSIVGFSQ